MKYVDKEELYWRLGHNHEVEIEYKNHRYTIEKCVNKYYIWDNEVDSKYICLYKSEYEDQNMNIDALFNIECLDGKSIKELENEIKIVYIF